MRFAILEVLRTLLLSESALLREVTARRFGGQRLGFRPEALRVPLRECEQRFPRDQHPPSEPHRFEIAALDGVINGPYGKVKNPRRRMPTEEQLGVEIYRHVRFRSAPACD